MSDFIAAFTALPAIDQAAAICMAAFIVFFAKRAVWG